MSSVDDWEDDFVILEPEQPLEDKPGSKTPPHLSHSAEGDGLDILQPSSPSMLLADPIAETADTIRVYQCEHPETRNGDSMAQQITQARAFCGWITYVLRQQNAQTESVQDLGLALTNGKILSPLVHSITGSAVEGLVEAQETHDKITNLDLVSDAFERQFPAAVFPNASAVASGNSKAIVDYAWQLFYHSTLQKIQYCGLEDRFALLLWIQHAVSSFPHVSLVSDFTQSLSDGLALCALIESKSPSSIDTRNLNNNQRTDNLRKAFDLAEELFHIPKVLAPIDVISPSPDEISMIIFLTMLYKA